MININLHHATDYGSRNVASAATLQSIFMFYKTVRPPVRPLVWKRGPCCLLAALMVDQNPPGPEAAHSSLEFPAAVVSSICFPLTSSSGTFVHSFISSLFSSGVVSAPHGGPRESLRLSHPPHPCLSIVETCEKQTPRAGPAGGAAPSAFLERLR